MRDQRCFIVGVREVHVQPYKVWARTPEEAVRIVEDGGGEMIEDGFEYSHTLDSEVWMVEEIEEEWRDEEN